MLSTVNSQYEPATFILIKVRKLNIPLIQDAHLLIHIIKDSDDKFTVATTTNFFQTLFRSGIMIPLQAFNNLAEGASYTAVPDLQTPNRLFFS